jgi:uncharacterized protein (DUF58 family)
MTLAELTAKIKHVEIKSRTLSDHIFAGDYHTAYKGRGMSFAEVREYAYGDDIRAIDWNVSARANHPYIKVFEEERELCFMLLIDTSASTLFGTRQNSKQDIITEIAATLAFSASKNNDKIGAIFFSDTIEKYIAPKKGKAQILNIIRTLLTITPQHNKTTNFGIALQLLNNVIKRKSIAFAISDFISTPYETELKISGRKHDITGLHIYDIAEKQLPNIGIVQTQDIETGAYTLLDTSSKNNRANYEKQFTHTVTSATNLFQQSRAKFLSIATNQDYVKALHQFFKNK